MNRLSGFAAAFLAAIAFSVLPPCCISVASPTELTTDTKGMLLRLPKDTLWIRIDDQKMPFVLTNIDQRFEAETLIKFMRAFFVHRSMKNESLSIVVESRTKRIVDGEDAFNDFVKKMAISYNLAFVFLPVPTGDNPNIEIRKFSKDFKLQGASTPRKSQ